ncbi:MAG TPA: nitroreductase family protein [Fimbriimonadaceae bacterium]|nr:nitroreductase family protein [Fimbriimonadaceae bacterium]
MSAFIPYRPARIDREESLNRLRQDFAVADGRRTVRMFSPDPIPREAIEWAIRIAGTAPSGAHRQPWFFVAISDPDMKQRIREAAEKEEREFYERKAPPEWLEALAPLGTDFVKSHLTDAPWLIVIFRRDYEPGPDGVRRKNYYMTESVGIAVGFLIQALHRAGFATLTHTPAPMTFLREICRRPQNEKPFLILPVGYPTDDCVVPDLKRKKLAEVAEFVE